MTFETIVLSGKEYVLVPLELFPGETEEVKQDISVSDFDPEEKRPLPLATNKEKEEAIRVVESTGDIHVQKAVPKPSGYQERFQKKRLLPTDVSARSNAADAIGGFVEDAYIHSMDYGGNLPPGKTGFYGKGIEIDRG